MEISLVNNHNLKRIAIGSDHVGYPLKEEIKKYLDELGYVYQDFGAFPGAHRFTSVR